MRMRRRPSKKAAAALRIPARWQRHVLGGLLAVGITVIIWRLCRRHAWWRALSRWTPWRGEPAHDEEMRKRRLEYFEPEGAARPGRSGAIRRRGRSPITAARDGGTGGMPPGDNPLVSPPRYAPAPLSASARELHVNEEVGVSDSCGGYASASAVLDTGNAHLTVIDADFARRHRIYDEGDAPLRWTTLRGVVRGASARAPVVSVRVRVREYELGPLDAAVSDLGGRPQVLVGVDVLDQLFAAGFRIAKA